MFKLSRIQKAAQSTGKFFADLSRGNDFHFVVPFEEVCFVFYSLKTADLNIAGC